MNTYDFVAEVRRAIAPEVRHYGCGEDMFFCCNLCSGEVYCDYGSELYKLSADELESHIEHDPECRLQDVRNHLNKMLEESVNDQ